MLVRQTIVFLGLMYLFITAMIAAIHLKSENDQISLCQSVQTHEIDLCARTGGLER